MKKTLLVTLALFGSSSLYAELFTEHFKDGVVKSQIEYKKIDVMKNITSMT